MSKIEVNAIEPQCGTTLTVGASGDTITFPTGTTIVNNGSQTGFGRTGTVDWDTTAKTASFTAVSGNGYFVNTTSGAITVTLPASPSAGDIVSVADYAGTAAANNITIARNGSNFEGGAEDGAIAVNRQTGTFVYADATQGWIAVNSNDASFLLPTYISATGGTITCCGDYKIHTFTGPGTFTVCSVGNPAGSTTVDYLVVAGGGAGGNAKDGTNGQAGGGGAGGYRESSGAASGCYTTSPLGSCVSALPVTATGYPITVGAGGASSSTDDSAPAGTGFGNPGSNSIFSTITSAGGGGGGRSNGDAGGSGGGSSCNGSVGSGNTPPVSPPQGNPGGEDACGQVSGGGGGATVAGSDGTYPSGPAGPGGAGAASSINGTPTTRAGGGGGGGNSGETGGGTGGSGGGGAGGIYNGGSGPGVNGTPGTTNSGGGGGATASANSAEPVSSGAGGSGIVIIRYKAR